MARVTGLEPATSGVTGRRSNQTELHPQYAISIYNFIYINTTIKWWAMTGSNRRPTRCKRVALPAELIALKKRRPLIYKDRLFLNYFDLTIY